MTDPGAFCGSILFGVGDGDGNEFHHQHHFFKSAFLKQLYCNYRYPAHRISYVWNFEMSSRFLFKKRDLA